MSGSALRELVSHSRIFVEQVIQEKEPLLVVSHYDADGLSSASIFTQLLFRLDVPFQLVFVEQTYPETLELLPFKDYKFVAFLDLGSGYKNYIRNFTQERHVLIVDHHVPVTEEQWEGLVEINPHIIGVDASTQTSSSTISYAVFEHFLGEDASLLPVAIVGALGDRLDVGDRFSLVGLNREIVEKGKRLGIIEESISLRLFGAKKRSIVDALASTMEPYIPGLSGNPSACIRFLESIGISPRESGNARMVASLSQEEVKHLASELIKYMITQGVNVKEAEKIFGYNYYDKREPDKSPLKDLREYAFVLNALGRLDHYGTALAINLGHRGKFMVRAEESIKEYRRLLAKQLSRILENQENLAKHGLQSIVYLIDENLPKLTGPLSSIIASEFAPALRKSGKTIVGVASLVNNEKYKISFRRIYENIDIGNLLKKYSMELGFIGGGHPAAGGALIDEKTLEKLLKKL